jgi:hypothetical protein
MRTPKQAIILRRLWPTGSERWVAHYAQPQVALEVDQVKDGLQVQVTLTREPTSATAVQLTVTGAAGCLLAQERLLVSTGARTITKLVSAPMGPVRCKVVLLEGDRVLESARIDLL